MAAYLKLKSVFLSCFVYVKLKVVINPLSFFKYRIIHYFSESYIHFCRSSGYQLSPRGGAAPLTPPPPPPLELHSGFAAVLSPNTLGLQLQRDPTI